MNQTPAYKPAKSVHPKSPGIIGLWLSLPIRLVTWTIAASLIAIIFSMTASLYLGLYCVSRFILQLWQSDSAQVPNAALLHYWPGIKAELNALMSSNGV